VIPGPAMLCIDIFQVRQYIYSVNGVNVLRQDHKSVAKAVMLNESILNIVVLSQKRDAAFLA